jgi:DNA-binding CsgD family transcriptional regulator
MPDPSWGLNLIVQNIISIGAGIFLAVYYYRYLVTQLKMKQDKWFNIKTLIICLLVTFLLGFVLSALLSNDIDAVRRYYAILPSIIAVYFGFRTYQFLTKREKELTEVNTPYALMLRMAYIGILFMATMPIVVMFGDHQTINNTLVNVSFFLVFFAYFKQQAYQTNLNAEIVAKMKYQSIADEIEKKTIRQVTDLPYGLTRKEVEVAHFILQNLKFISIAHELKVSDKTISKHASNIYKKTNCVAKDDFIDKFSKEISLDEKSKLELEMTELKNNLS